VAVGLAEVTVLAATGVVAVERRAVVSNEDRKAAGRRDQGIAGMGAAAMMEVAVRVAEAREVEAMAVASMAAASMAADWMVAVVVAEVEVAAAAREETARVVVTMVAAERMMAAAVSAEDARAAVTGATGRREESWVAVALAMAVRAALAKVEARADDEVVEVAAHAVVDKEATEKVTVGMVVMREARREVSVAAKMAKTAAASTAKASTAEVREAASRRAADPNLSIHRKGNCGRCSTHRTTSIVYQTSRQTRK